MAGKQQRRSVFLDGPEVLAELATKYRLLGWQIKALTNIVAKFHAKQPALLTGPPGIGKTYMLATLAALFVGAGSRTMIVATSDIHPTWSELLTAFEIPHDVVTKTTVMSESKCYIISPDRLGANKGNTDDAIGRVWGLVAVDDGKGMGEGAIHTIASLKRRHTIIVTPSPTSEKFMWMLLQDGKDDQWRLPDRFISISDAPSELPACTIEYVNVDCGPVPQATNERNIRAFCLDMSRRTLTLAAKWDAFDRIMCEYRKRESRLPTIMVLPPVGSAGLFRIGYDGTSYRFVLCTREPHENPGPYVNCNGDGVLFADEPAGHGYPTTMKKGESFVRMIPIIGEDARSENRLALIQQALREAKDAFSDSNDVIFVSAGIFVHHVSLHGLSDHMVVAVPLMDRGDAEGVVGRLRRYGGPSVVVRFLCSTGSWENKGEIMKKGWNVLPSARDQLLRSIHCVGVDDSESEDQSETPDEGSKKRRTPHTAEKSPVSIAASSVVPPNNVPPMKRVRKTPV